MSTGNESENRVTYVYMREEAVIGLNICLHCIKLITHIENNCCISSGKSEQCLTIPGRTKC